MRRHVCLMMPITKVDPFKVEADDMEGDDKENATFWLGWEEVEGKGAIKSRHEGCRGDLVGRLNYNRTIARLLSLLLSFTWLNLLLRKTTSPITPLTFSKSKKQLIGRHMGPSYACCKREDLCQQFLIHLNSKAVVSTQQVNKNRKYWKESQDVKCSAVY